jgi:hypothetical protein
VAWRADRSVALIAWKSRFLERNEGVKGGFAAALRFTLDALVPFKQDDPSDQGRRWKFVSHVPEQLCRPMAWLGRRATRIGFF